MLKKTSKMTPTKRVGVCLFAQCKAADTREDCRYVLCWPGMSIILVSLLDHIYILFTITLLNKFSLSKKTETPRANGVNRKGPHTCTIFEKAFQRPAVVVI